MSALNQLTSSLTPSEQVGLLRRAFPAERFADIGTCAWCGKPRKRSQALCRGCWATIAPRMKTVYLSMPIMERAQWIVDRKP